MSEFVGRSKQGRSSKSEVSVRLMSRKEIIVIPSELLGTDSASTEFENESPKNFDAEAFRGNKDFYKRFEQFKILMKKKNWRI